MEKVKAAIATFFRDEYRLNRSNYNDSAEEWDSRYMEFKRKYLNASTDSLWFKIPVQGFDADRRERLKEQVLERHCYLIKIYTKDKTEVVNVFCSVPTDENELRYCLVLMQADNSFTLVAMETICESCLGRGFLDKIDHKCTECLGRGFKKSENSDLVNWSTPHYDAEPVTEIQTIDVPASEEQLQAILYQTKMLKK